jgi:hypothetical protein
MKKLLILLTLILYGCTDDTCICIETITNIRNNNVYVRDYIIECDSRLHYIHPSPPYPRIYGYQRVWDYVCTIYYIIWAYVRGTI